MYMSNLRFLALGDSYTIGEGVNYERCWPVQLASSLGSFGFPIRGPQIIAQTGWTVSELEAGIKKAAPRGPFELVSLQIGVNNQYRAGVLGRYKTEFRGLLEQAVAYAGGDAQRVVVLSIPDWSVTPFAAGRDRGKIRREINEFNRVNAAAAQAAGAPYVDVTPISRRASHDPRLLADDELHPSGGMYALWIEQILPIALTILGVNRT
jgi:lysophospholipase L1-like esterase